MAEVEVVVVAVGPAVVEGADAVVLAAAAGGAVEAAVAGVADEGAGRDFPKLPKMLDAVPADVAGAV